MKLMSLITMLLLSFTPFFAQESNIFLSRDYWKSNPSISDIDQKIKEGNNVSVLNRFAFDAVSYALIEKVDNKVIKHLLDYKGNGVNKLTHDGRTYIFWAAYKNNLEMMRYLVEKGAKTDVIDNHGYSLLNFAALTGQTNSQLYDFLIANGANPGLEKNNVGANAMLLVAPFIKNDDIIKYFIGHGLDLKSTDVNGNGIFNYASKGGNTAVLDRLIDKQLPYKNLNKLGGNAMIFASQGTRGNKNSLEVYEYLESKGIAVNVVGNEGKNPLHAVASASDDLDVFRFFLERDVDVNLKDKSGYSPFMNAVNTNTLEVVKFLEPYVTNINATTHKGETALMMAVQRSDLNVVQFLMDSGADINAIDTAGNSLVYYLINGYRRDTSQEFDAKLNVLLKAGLDVTKLQGGGNSLYHIAVDKNDLELLKRLYTLNPKGLNIKNSSGLTPLHLAAMKANNETILKYLIAIGSDKMLTTSFEETVYDLAFENELLQKNNIDINFLK